MISWRYALQELLRRPGRSLLSLFSVVIAVGAIVAVAFAAATAREAYERVFQALGGRADLEIVARGGTPFRQDAAGPIEELSEVRTVVPLFHRVTIVYGHGRRAKALAVGIVPSEAESLAGFKISQGRMPAAPEEVLLESNLAEGLNLHVGDTIRLLTPRGLRRHAVCGLVSLRNAVRLQEGGMLLAPIDHLQRLFNANGEINGLQLFLKEPRRATELIEKISARLPDDLRVRVPAARTGLAEETLRMTEMSLNMASAMSFTTAIFIVLNVFLMNVGERRRQLSILRAVGATRRQVIGMVCREALILGVAGSLIGIPAGIYGGQFLTRSLEDMIQVSLPEVTNLHWPLLVGGLFGPALCLLAAWYPAYAAGQVSPLEGMRPLVAAPARQSHRLTTIAGLCGLFLTVASAVLSTRGAVSAWVAIGGVMTSLVSIVLLLPVALVPTLKVLAWPLRGILWVEGEISQRLLDRHVGRSSLTIGVLLVAVATGIGTSNAVFSITQDVRTWYESTITADFLLRTMMPDMTGEEAVTMPESLGSEIAGLEGVARLDVVRFLRVEAAGQDAVLVARDFDLYDQIPLAIVRGRPDTVLKSVNQGEVVVGSGLAERAGLHLGDTIDVALGAEHHSFRVCGMATEYTFGGSVVYVDRKVAKQRLPFEGVDAYLVKTNAADSSDLQAKLRDIAERDGLLLQSFSEVLRFIDSMVSSIVAGLWLLLSLGLLVGALGVINTLTMNVLEQTRELGMLRAIGMRRGQIVRTVLGQALLIGLFGVLGGGIVGITLARLTNLCLASLFGRYVPFALRPGFALTLLALAMAFVLVAALLPACRAARLNPIQATRYE